jgi:MinD-like ATPase involved in chromosome partitioning or flagellar assembly
MKTQAATKRVIFSMGSKGGTGKTTFTLALAEWFAAQSVNCILLDLDVENKVKGSLCHSFPKAAKINVNTPAGLDSFVDHLDGDASVLLADMGAGQGQVAHDWFDSMYEGVSGLGIALTGIAVCTDDPASVDGLLSWGAALQDRVDYIVVENAITAFADFRYWRHSEQANRFREIFHPTVIQMAYRVPDLETACRNHGVTLGQVAGRQTTAAELQRTSLVLRAQSYRSQLFSEIEKARRFLLP